MANNFEGQGADRNSFDLQGLSPEERFVSKAYLVLRDILDTESQVGMTATMADLDTATMLLRLSEKYRTQP